MIERDHFRRSWVRGRSVPRFFKRSHDVTWPRRVWAWNWAGSWSFRWLSVSNIHILVGKRYPRIYPWILGGKVWQTQMWVDQPKFLCVRFSHDSRPCEFASKPWFCQDILPFQISQLLWAKNWIIKFFGHLLIMFDPNIFPYISIYVLHISYISRIKLWISDLMGLDLQKFTWSSKDLLWNSLGIWAHWEVLLFSMSMKFRS